ncbi:MAG: hypothetical protein JJ899_03080 [Alphaproteobacteria bacterium]|nr:hypothetical protein [Alphaproteobacteria bacterium]
MNDPLSRWRRRNRAYRTVFATPEGKRVLQDLHAFCMQPVPSADANDAVFAMGMQRVFRRVAALSAADEDALVAFALNNEEIGHDD